MAFRRFGAAATAITLALATSPAHAATEIQWWHAMTGGIAAFRAGNAPAIMQVFEVGTATMMAATGSVKPVYKLMAETGEKFDPKAYLPTITGYYSTSKGEMLSFPFNSSSTVMWVNL